MWCRNPLFSAWMGSRIACSVKMTPLLHQGLQPMLKLTPYPFYHLPNLERCKQWILKGNIWNVVPREVVELFIATYSYKVPKNEENQYLEIQRKVKEIYCRHGCLGYEVFKSDDDCWLEINKFKDRQHYEKVEKSADLDPEIEILWKEFCAIVQRENIVIRKYEKVL